MPLDAPFYWWRVNQYGCAEPVADSRAVRDMIDSSINGPWYATVEGTILHGGVIATAFERKTEQTYDAAAWLRDGSKIPMGTITTTKITAERGLDAAPGAWNYPEDVYA